ncbi:hypothetical protein U1Q18_043792 [Sarracenia purpurea var. burkii]
MDKDFVTLLRTESKSFTAELFRFDKDPDPFSPSKMASLEARIRSLKGLSPVKAEDRVGTTKEESLPGGPPFLKVEKPSVVDPPVYEGKGREGDVQDRDVGKLAEETYTVGKAESEPEHARSSDQGRPLKMKGEVSDGKGQIIENSFEGRKWALKPSVQYDQGGDLRHSWSHIVKGGNQSLTTKPQQVTKLEFIAPKNPDLPEVIEIEAACDYDAVFDLVFISQYFCSFQ